MTKDELSTKGFDLFYNVLTNPERVSANPSVFCTDSSDAEFENLHQLKRLHVVYLSRKKEITGISTSFVQYVYKLTEFGYQMRKLILHSELTENESRDLFAKHVFEHLKKVI